MSAEVERDDEDEIGEGAEAELEVESGAHAVQHEDIIEFMVARWPDTLA